jgi:hypothetical protein
MPPDLLLETEVVRLTCEIVSAHCKSLPIEACDLPGLIASVGKSLSAQKPPLAQEASGAAQNPRSGSKARPAQARKPRAVGTPQRASQLAPLQAAPATQAEGTNVVYLNAFSRAAAPFGQLRGMRPEGKPARGR